MAEARLQRREFCRTVAVSAVAVLVDVSSIEADDGGFKLRYIVASSLYGHMRLVEVVGEVRLAGAEHIDIWPEHHADHREQMDAMGKLRFRALLSKHGIRLGILTRYDLGPFGLQAEMDVLAKLEGSMVISGSRGPAGLKGSALKKAVAKFVEVMKPHIDTAEQRGVTIGIENHGNSLIESVDSIRWFAELVRSRHVGIALAPYHLPQDPDMIAALIGDLGERLVHFYAWQYGMGCHKELPKNEELMQLPGRGRLDFTPLVVALKKIGYRGWMEIFMHPVPRGIPIHPTAAEVTQEIVRARDYLDGCLSAT